MPLLLNAERYAPQPLGPRHLLPAKSRLVPGGSPVVRGTFTEASS